MKKHAISDSKGTSQSKFNINSIEALTILPYCLASNAPSIIRFKAVFHLRINKIIEIKFSSPDIVVFINGMKEVACGPKSTILIFGKWCF